MRLTGSSGIVTYDADRALGGDGNGAACS